MERTDAPAAPGLTTQIVVGVVAAAITVGCTLLGWWQWDRAHVRGKALGVEQPVPLAHVLTPASASEGALGSTVSVEGTFGDGNALVWGRQVDGAPAVLLLREFTVDAAATGTGEPATLVVLVGYGSADSAPSLPSAHGQMGLTGYLRVGESPPTAPVSRPGLASVDAHDTSAVSPAELAQLWPGPLYSAVLVASDGIGAWVPMPLPEPTAELNLQSAAYAVEWWLFGAFAAFVAGRWIRDSRLKSRPTPGSSA